MWWNKLNKVLFVSIIFCYNNRSPLLAQIVPDSSLGSENSIVVPNVNVKDALVDLIEGGAIRDNNLFHSFSEFNVSNGSKVYFANPDGIANILTRVTGNNLSQIFGTLGVDGGANLFLLNPNGIVFGENAALDVNGSFLATTADSYIFNNGWAYSATNPTSPPLLTINIPVGIQMGNNSAAIEIQGTGNNLILDEFTFTPITDERTIGLEVKPGNTLALLGGEINLTGGNLTAAKGNIELGSVGEAETIYVHPADNGFTVDYGKVTNFRDITLTQASSLDISGSGGGNINLKGKNISVLEGSAIIANTWDIDDGGKVEITATDAIAIRDTNEQFFPSGIYSVSEGMGNAANLILNGESLVVKDGAQLSSTTFSQGNSGNIGVNVSEIELIGTTPDFLLPSGIYSVSEGMGNAGNITLNGESLVIKDGGQISSLAFSQGNSGNLSINVLEMEITGITADNLLSSGIYSSSLGTGNVGNLTLNGESLVIKDGAQISSGTSNKGNSGNLSVNVSEIEIIGTTPDYLFPSGFYSTSEGTGNAGNLTLNGESLVIKDGGQISSGTFDRGDGGNISINVSEIEIIGTTPDFLSASGMFSSSEGMGNAGNLTLNGERLVLTNGGLITSGTFEQGNSGNISVNVSEIEIAGTTPDGSVASGLFSTSRGTGNAGNITVVADRINLDRGGHLNAEINQGKQGNINLITNNIFLDRNSQITTKASNNATGGNISIDNTENIVLRGNSQIIADAIEGDGGNIDLTTEGYFVSSNSKVSASSQFGLDGNIEVETIKGDRNIELNSLPENPVDGTQQITTGCSLKNNFAIVGKGGLPDNPGQYLRSQTVWQDLRLPTINTAIITTQVPISSSPPKKPIIEAKSLVVNSQGNIELVGDTKQSYFYQTQYKCFVK